MPIKPILFAGMLALALPLSLAPALAKGCLKGAAVGGVAGHVAGHHTLTGAAAGCAVGHHEATKHAGQKAEQTPSGNTAAQAGGTNHSNQSAGSDTLELHGEQPLVD